jgi:hypothetical protein
MSTLTEIPRDVRTTLRRRAGAALVGAPDAMEVGR